ncbi:MAG: AAA family ATPase [Hyphomicrobiaceae bacterium]
MTGMAWAGRLGIVIALIIIERASPALAWVLVILAGVGAVLLALYGGRYLPAPVLGLVDRMTGRASPKERPRAPTVIDEAELARYLKSRVVGQDQVIDALARRVRQRLAARREGKPIAVMCFAGPPGVGKTYLAKCVAEKLYGEAGHLHILEMARFKDDHSAASLFGVPAGYSGHGEPGVLSKGLRDTPNCIILLDEFEKASRQIHLQFLSAWNDGFVTDLGTASRFSTTEAIFVLTTNAGAARIVERARDPTIAQDDLNRLAKAALVDADFAPEVMSRIDDVFAFREPAGLDIARIVALEMERMTREYQLEIVPQGIDPEILIQAMTRVSEGKAEGGVREISRDIEHLIADGLIEARANNARRIRFVAAGRGIEVVPIGDDDAPGPSSPARYPADYPEVADADTAASASAIRTAEGDVAPAPTALRDRS